MYQTSSGISCYFYFTSHKIERCSDKGEYGMHVSNHLNEEVGWSIDKMFYHTINYTYTVHAITFAAPGFRYNYDTQLAQVLSHIGMLTVFRIT